MDDPQRLSDCLARMQEQRQGVVSAIQDLSQIKLDFQPVPDSWSIGQVGYHVGLVEKGMTGIVKDMLQAYDANRGAPLRVGYDELPITPKGMLPSIFRSKFVLQPFAFMMRILPRPIHEAIMANPLVKAKTAPQLEPKAGMPRETILTFLKEVRQSTLELVESLKGRDLSKFHWEHHLLGYQDVYGTLDLIADHDHRHLQQINKVKSDPRFPAL